MFDDRYEDDRHGKAFTDSSVRSGAGESADVERNINNGTKFSLTRAVKD